MSRLADPRKQQQWLQHIRRWQASRLSVREYCDRHQLREANFYCWKRTLRQRGLLTVKMASDGLAPHADTGGKAPFFLPVAVAGADAATGRIDLVLPDGWIVRVAAGFDAGTLRQLLAVLRERPC
jgi:hypothetical protein